MLRFNPQKNCFYKIITTSGGELEVFAEYIEIVLLRNWGGKHPHADAARKGHFHILLNSAHTLLTWAYVLRSPEEKQKHERKQGKKCKP